MKLRALDLLLFALLSVVTFAGAIADAGPLVGVLWAVALLVPVWWCRRAPDVVFGWLMLLAVVQLAFRIQPGPVNAPHLVALYFVAALGLGRLRRVWAGAAAVGTMLGAVVTVLDEVGKVRGSSLLTDFAIAACGMFGMALLVWGGGRYVAQRRMLVEVQEARVVQQVQLAVATQREDIARDVHDIIGHSLALIAVQAESAHYLVEASEDEIDLDAAARLEAAGEALGEIRRLTRGALAETRTLTSGLLTESKAPMPGLADVDVLVADCRATGVAVEYLSATISGLTQTAELALYRVVQEALTNAMKHASGAEVAVELVDGDDVIVRVSNALVAPAKGPGGTGLAGLRRRIAAVGGEFRAGVVGARFEVEARVPRERGEA